MTTTLVATPLEAVAFPSPVTVPGPPVFAKATTVALSPVAVLPAASLIVAVSVWLSPEAVEPEWVSSICAPGPWTTVKAPRVPVVSPAAVASIVTGPARTPVIVLVATPLAAVALPVPVTVPAPEALAKATTVELSAVTVLPAASWIVAVSTRFAPEVRLAVEPVERDLRGGAVDDGEGAERAGRQPGRGGFHRDGAGEHAGDRLRGDAAGGGRVAGAADGAGAGGLGEGDDGASCRR